MSFMGFKTKAEKRQEAKEDLIEHGACALIGAAGALLSLSLGGMASVGRGISIGLEHAGKCAQDIKKYYDNRS